VGTKRHRHPRGAIFTVLVLFPKVVLYMVAYMLMIHVLR
jgi:hypothetical protein